MNIIKSIMNTGKVSVLIGGINSPIKFIGKTELIGKPTRNQWVEYCNRTGKGSPKDY